LERGRLNFISWAIIILYTILASSNIAFLELIYLRILRFAYVSEVAPAPARVIIDLMLIVAAAFVIQLDSVSYSILSLENI
jgi:hypothetical protein